MVDFKKLSRTENSNIRSTSSRARVLPQHQNLKSPITIKVCLQDNSKTASDHFPGKKSLSPELWRISNSLLQTTISPALNKKLIGKESEKKLQQNQLKFTINDWKAGNTDYNVETYGAQKRIPGYFTATIVEPIEIKLD
jgi:hypothetical protein